MNYIYYNYIQKCPPTKTKLQQIYPTDKSDILKNKNLKPLICSWFIIIYDSTHDSIAAFSTSFSTPFSTSKESITLVMN